MTQSSLFQSNHRAATSSLSEQIHHQTLQVSQSYKRCEAELIELLEKCDQHQVYLHYGYASLFQYAVNELKLSESVIYNLISVMRVARKVPELKTEIKAGNITLSNARKIAPVLTLKSEQANQKEWMIKASTLSQRKLEKEVIKVRPLSAVPERASYVTESRIKLELALFEKNMLDLRRAQDLVSQAQCKAASLEETLIALTDFYLKHKDPVRKAKRVIVKKGSQGKNPDVSNTNQENVQSTQSAQSAIKQVGSKVESSFVNHSQQQTQPVSLQVQNTRLAKSQSQPQRIPIPAAILHQVHSRDQRQCQHKNNQNKICGSNRWLHIHHIQPVNQGGENTLSNLITLCLSHHQWVHRMEDK